ncbi:MAG: mycofactocin biosynthesis chaperone MftB [Gammaproteobacteria bacterium]|nr:mycofactocin biosynthesis chaperone MftB [Gammaproteobacteria bacterium]
MNLEISYRLAPSVAIRPERFGGLVYRYDNRRLYFLHSHELVEFVRELDGKRPLREALADFLRARDLPDSAQDTLIKALTQLLRLDILSPASPPTRAPDVTPTLGIASDDKTLRGTSPPYSGGRSPRAGPGSV